MSISGAWSIPLMAIYAITWIVIGFKALLEMFRMESPSKKELKRAEYWERKINNAD